MYIACLKNNIAVATAICNSIEEMQPSLSMYDELVEITEEEFNSIELPAERSEGGWVHTDTVPTVEYPETVTVPTELEQLRADVDFIAVMSGIEL